MSKVKIFRLVLISLVALVSIISYTAKSAFSQSLIPEWTSVDHAPFNLVEPMEITNPILTASDVTDVSAAFVADPFLFYENGNWYMFFEVLNNQSGLGEIGLARSTDGLNWQYDQIVLSENNHLSYPFIFKYNGEYYMSPETFWAKEVRLYRATNFPYDWVHVYTLVRGRDFSDRAIFHHNNIWWMFVGNTGHSYCYLYYSNSLTSGWIEHPMSPIVRNDKSKARPGGRSFVLANNRIIRIAQKDVVLYGEAVRAFEVDILTKTDYAEHEVEESPILRPSGIGWNAKGMHHFDPWWNGDHWLCAVDGSDGHTWSIGVMTAPQPSNYANIAPLATGVSASSENTVTKQYAVKAVDECIEGYSNGDYKCEWATKGKKAGAWIRLSWDDLYRVGKVVIYDRPNSDDQVIAATLSFDDGSTIPVGKLDNGGGPVVVTFAPRVIGSLTFTVNAVSSTTINIGLCEIEVFGVPE